jgi:hypothetical protein
LEENIMVLKAWEDMRIVKFIGIDIMSEDHLGIEIRNVKNDGNRRTFSKNGV